MFTYLQADSWDESSTFTRLLASSIEKSAKVDEIFRIVVELNRRVQLQVLWDGDHTTHIETPELE